MHDDRSLSKFPWLGGQYLIKKDQIQTAVSFWLVGILIYREKCPSFQPFQLRCLSLLQEWAVCLWPALNGCLSREFRTGCRIRYFLMDLGCPLWEFEVNRRREAEVAGWESRFSCVVPRTIDSNLLWVRCSWAYGAGSRPSTECCKVSYRPFNQEGRDNWTNEGYMAPPYLDSLLWCPSYFWT